MKNQTLETLAKENLDKWKDKGRETTHYKCPNCNGSVEIRKPDPNMVTQKGYWEKVRECYICHNLSIVKTWPDGKALAE